MAAVSRRFVHRCATATPTLRRLILSAASRRISGNSSTPANHYQHPAAYSTCPSPATKDLPNEEYCSITIGEYMIGTAPMAKSTANPNPSKPTPPPEGLNPNSFRFTLRFLVDQGTKGVLVTEAQKYKAERGQPAGRCEAKKVEEGLFVRIDVPGVGKEGLMIWAEKDKVFIVGDGRVASKFDNYGKRHNSEIELCPKANYETDKIKAELKAGVLRMIIPKKLDIIYL